MTRITGKEVHTEENQGTVSIQTGGSERLGISQGGALNWALAASALTATTGTFTANAGTTAVSGSSWTGNTGTRAYTVHDIVSALKLYGILPSS